MGYDLHISRAKDWTDSEANPITEGEWWDLVAADPDLELAGAAETETPDGVLRYENPGLALWRAHPTDEKVWFDFRNGRVVVKNPDEPSIAKMLEVARELGARVVGDDGETYEVPGGTPRPATVSFSARLAAWFQRLRPTPRPAVALPPFGVGDRVRDSLGNEATVLAIDPTAMHGFGSITVRFDDGRELTFAMFAHNLEPVEATERDS